VTVVDPNGSGSGRVSFTSNGGTATCSLSWHGRDPQASDPPIDQPTSSAEPSESPTGVETASVESAQTEPLTE
jgi:hypothetical protein